MRPIRSLAPLALLAAAACTSEPATTPTLPRNVDIDHNAILVKFASCPDLEQAIEDGLVLRMRSALEGRVWWWWGVPDGSVVAASPDAAPAGAGPSAYTTTNNQVEGVAEADFVQNDGTRIAVVANGQLQLARSWPPEDLKRTSSIDIEGWPHDLFLTGDQAIVFSSVYVPRAIEGGVLACPMLDAGPGGAFQCGYWADNFVKITAVDVSNLSSPKVVSEAYLPGSYTSARRIQDRVRLVTSDRLPFPSDVLFWPPNLPWDASEEERKAAFDELAARNEALIRSRSLDDWLRRGTVKRPGLPDVDLGYDCKEFATNSSPTLPGILTVATFDVAASALVSRTSVFGDPGVVYASQQTLYVASRHWWWWPEPGQRDATYLHGFDLRDPDRAVYIGTGTVDGSVHDQYALDEHEGALRAVTQVTERVDDGSPWGQIQISGRVTVLKPQEYRLKVVGETAPFGKGERVFGTRFLGTRGFAITARQIDPLFTFDLTDPTKPTLVGELEMPGFISYLHPIDATHLLGVGQQRTVGGPNQVKVTLLDVADLAHPIEVSTALVGEGWAWSEALWNPKAFTWFGARQLLAIPFAEWGWDTPFVSDLRLFHVDPVTGVTPVGSLSMASIYADDSGTPFDWSWSPYVRRSILADDWVYAISDAGIRSAKVAELPAWLATIEFAPYGKK